MKNSVRLFRNDLEARFIERPNRFRIVAGTGGKGGEKLDCHCPNPGRLSECLFPGAELILEKRIDGNGAAKTAWTAAAIRYRGNIAPLYASRANLAAKALFLREIVPGVREIRPEFAAGGSRFDFLCIDREGRRHLVEVKACSLVEYDIAMFPDAPSARALKHLEELAALSGEGCCCHVLFVILHSRPKSFVPNLHTDPAFAAALSRFCAGPNPPVTAHAALIRCREDGLAEAVASRIPVDLSHGGLAASDSGNYLIVLELPESGETGVGGLGNIRFDRGWYVYAGSARKNLAARISRHLRKTRKQKHWHIDYLTPLAGRIEALPVMSYRNLECDLAGELAKLGGKAVPGFGSSDCGGKGRRCPSHLYYFSLNPLLRPDFMDMLFRYRHREGLNLTH
ncbi:MAG: DNA/RNA nuclease SfsA [Treponema sp.]|jgi:sugar fermentation stimulation protein A|nr:DNA/RNA nuclease SfsA [Treponema sp.]